MQQGEIHRFRISGVNNEGEGVVRTEDGFVLFVPDALPGEEVTCRITRVKKNYGLAKVLERSGSSPDRTEPLCPHFSRCGGCQLQHMTYKAQLKMKTSSVYDALKRIGGIVDPAVEECLPSPSLWGYRNKASMPVQRSRTEKFIAGFYKRRSHEIIQLKECKVLLPELENNILHIVQALREIGLSGYDERQQNNVINFIRHIVLRQGKFSGESLCGVVGTKKIGETEKGGLCRKIKNEFPALNGLIYNQNSSTGNFIWGDAFDTVLGTHRMAECLGSYSFNFEISSFFQINSEQTVNLYNKATELACENSPRRILELYSGVGSLTAFLAAGAERVTAVESWEPAARYILPNAKNNGLDNVEACSGRAEDLVKELGDNKYETVVLDPPRSGCAPEVISAIMKIAPSKIIYVSCNPATLARDVKLMTSDRYTLKTALPFDMFPQTGHVECVASLSRT